MILEIFAYISAAIITIGWVCALIFESILKSSKKKAVITKVTDEKTVEGQ